MLQSVSEVLRQLNRELVNNEALRFTVTTTRQHPGLCRWHDHPGQDSAHDEVVRRWKEASAIAGSMPRKHPDKHLRWLLAAAERFLAEEDDRLAAAWRHVTSSPAWAGLPQSARDLYTVLHAQARERGKYGGPHVLLCHSLAIAMIFSATGTHYRSKATITKAREALISAGFITAEVGQPWQPGVKSRPTVYDLLPEALASELSPPPPLGIVHSGTTAGECRPQWSDSDRHIFERTSGLLRQNRRREAEQIPVTLAEIAAFLASAREMGTPAPQPPPPGYEFSAACVRRPAPAGRGAGGKGDAPARVVGGPGAPVACRTAAAACLGGPGRLGLGALGEGQRER